MKGVAHLKSLRQKHIELKRVIQTSNKISQDELAIKKLKKKKLLLKERIVDMEQVVNS